MSRRVLLDPAAFFAESPAHDPDGFTVRADWPSNGGASSTHSG